MKILIADDISDSALEVFKAQPAWTVVNLPAKPAGAGSLNQEIADADALIVRSATKVTAELLDHASRLRVIGRAGVGIDNVDLEASTQRALDVLTSSRLLEALDLNRESDKVRARYGDGKPYRFTGVNAYRNAVKQDEWDIVYDAEQFKKRAD